MYCTYRSWKGRGLACSSSSSSSVGFIKITHFSITINFFLVTYSHFQIWRYYHHHYYLERDSHFTGNTLFIHYIVHTHTFDYHYCGISLHIFFHTHTDLQYFPHIFLCYLIFALIRFYDAANDHINPYS